MRSDDSCISNPKSEISNWTQGSQFLVQFQVSDFGFEMQESSNFEISMFRWSKATDLPLPAGPPANLDGVEGRAECRPNRDLHLRAAGPHPPYVRAFPDDDFAFPY